LWQVRQNRVVSSGSPQSLQMKSSADLPAFPQVALRTTPTRSLYDFDDQHVLVTLTFLTTALPDALADRLTRIARDPHYAVAQVAEGTNGLHDILAVMHASGLPDAYFMGYSMGAMLTVRFLMLYPERVRRAVVAGIGDNYFAEQQYWREAVARAMLTEDPSTIADDEARRFRIFGGQRGKDRLALAACMRGSRHIYSPVELGASKRPVLVVAGENDTLAGSPFALAQSFANGRALVLPNKDHMTAVGDPGYKRAVLDFFAETV